ncbi:MAG: SRPBCC family protein [Parachlamydiaceae bacterium]|nr:SRPBCC family protein [Parachlamydiaceae bacterium]
MIDDIRKSIELNAPISKVWKALSDYLEFGEWFQVKIEGPFNPGKVSRGVLTYPGYEDYKWEIVVQRMEPEKFFSFTWHPYAIDKTRDYSKEAQTLIEFQLKEIPPGTLLQLKESGFDQVPSDRRSEAFQMNQEGWSVQLENIKRFVTKN